MSPQGIREAQATAHALRAVPIRQVYTSPLLRAKQTAALIAACCGLAVIEEERLRERANWGDVPGQSLAEFVERWERSTHAPTSVPPCNGYLAHPFEKETPWAFTARLFFVVRWVSAIDPGGEWFSYTRENTVLWAADYQERHAQTA